MSAAVLLPLDFARQALEDANSFAIKKHNEARAKNLLISANEWLDKGLAYTEALARLPDEDAPPSGSLSGSVIGSCADRMELVAAEIAGELGIIPGAEASNA